MANNMEEKKDDLILYYTPTSLNCQVVIMALLEKKLQFKKILIDLEKNEQYEPSFLEINDKGEVPALIHKEKVITDSLEILKYIDDNFGIGGSLFTGTEEKYPLKYFKDKFENFHLKIGLAFHYKTIMKYENIGFLTLRFDEYQNETDIRNKCCRKYYDLPLKYEKLFLEITDEKTLDHLTDKIEKLRREMANETIIDFKNFKRTVWNNLKNLFDEIEKELSNPERLGPYLTGLRFAAPDILFAVILCLCYKWGFEKFLWEDGIRPNLQAYANLVLSRTSVQEATNVNNASIFTIYDENFRKQSDSINVATIGLTLIVSLGAIYVAKKMIKK